MDQFFFGGIASTGAGRPSLRPSKAAVVSYINCQGRKGRFSFSVSCCILVSAWIVKSGGVYNYEKHYWKEGDNNGKEKTRNG
jgi:hypothetical protein